MDINNIIINRPKSKAKPKPKAKSKNNNDNKTNENNSKLLSESDSFNDIHINTEPQLIYPCKDEILKTKVILRPDQMNNDLYLNLKSNLIDNVEGKCMSYGFVIKVYKILEYSNCIIDPEDFSGNVVYNIKYLAKICISLVNTIIVGKIFRISDNEPIIIVRFGNIQNIIISKVENYINLNNFTIINNNIIYKNTGKKLSINDNVKVLINSVKIINYNNLIMSIGFLNDIPSEQEVTSFGYTDNDDDNIINNNIKNYKELNFNDDIGNRTKNIKDV